MLIRGDCEKIFCMHFTGKKFSARPAGGLPGYSGSRWGRTQQAKTEIEGTVDRKILDAVVSARIARKVGPGTAA
jgi:hypothetical protein